MKAKQQSRRRGYLPQCAPVLAALALLVGGTPPLKAVPAPDANSVLILDSTVSGGAGSVEAFEAGAAGFTVVMASDAVWAATTAAEFGTYRALILGDATCSGPGTGALAAAEANRTVWSLEVDGNIIVIGTDERYHDAQGGRLVTIDGIKFAADVATKTGLFCSLSCYYHGTPSGTPVAVMDQFGAFTITGIFTDTGDPDCYNDAHIVAIHPALVGITDASLSNWSCSVHEAFDGYPATFLPLAIAEDRPGSPPFPGSQSFPDGTHGVPYILARGEGLVLKSDIILTPPTAENPTGTPHSVTATVTTNDPDPDTPVVGTTVTFLILSGPNAGETGQVDTDAFGMATFSYTGDGGVGTDIISATFVDAAGVTKTSNTATKTWVVPSNTPPDVSLACPSTDCLWPPNHKFVPVTIGCVTDAEGDPVTIVITSVTSDESTASAAGAGGGVTHWPDASGVGTATAKLRAERSGLSDGRVYKITFTASDGLASSNGSVEVKVPHDQRDKTCPAGDSGQIYDATLQN